MDHKHKAVHKHKTVKPAQSTRCWTCCITPIECAAKPDRQAAHGNIICEDVCRCGASRLSEINGGRVNYGPWYDRWSESDT